MIYCINILFFSFKAFDNFYQCLQKINYDVLIVTSGGFYFHPSTYPASTPTRGISLLLTKHVRYFEFDLDLFKRTHYAMTNIFAF